MVVKKDFNFQGNYNGLDLVILHKIELFNCMFIHSTKNLAIISCVLCISI
jgi:hypothetical protein